MLAIDIAVKVNAVIEECASTPISSVHHFHLRLVETGDPGEL